LRITEHAVGSRPKNYLTEAEMESFLKAARKGRHGARDFAMMLLAYRHTLRVSELVNTRVADVDLVLNSNRRSGSAATVNLISIDKG